MTLKDCKELTSEQTLLYALMEANTELRIAKMLYEASGAKPPILFLETYEFTKEVFSHYSHQVNPPPMDWILSNIPTLSKGKIG